MLGSASPFCWKNSNKVLAILIIGRTLKEQLAGLRETAALSIEGEFGKGIPLALSTGRARKQEEQFAAREQRLIDRLGIAREDRELGAKIAEIGLQGALQDAELSAKIFQAQQKQEDRLLDQARDLKDDQRDILADITDIGSKFAQTKHLTK